MKQYRIVSFLHHFSHSNAMYLYPTSTQPVLLLPPIVLSLTRPDSLCTDLALSFTCLLIYLLCNTTIKEEQNNHRTAVYFELYVAVSLSDVQRVKLEWR